jgi:hypothetical protein
MKWAEGKFWPAAALAALLLCALLALRGGGAPAQADGTAVNGYLALNGGGQTDHLYIFDTNHKALLVYQARPGGFDLVAGRNLEKDRVFVRSQPGEFLKYKAVGYSAEDIHRALSVAP